MRFIPLDRVGLVEQALAEAIANGRIAQRRDALGAALGLHGLRVEEVCRAESRDFSPTARTLHVRTIKGGIPRDVPLHESLVQALLAWRRAAGVESGAWLLPTIRGRKVAATQLQRYLRRLTRRVFGEEWRFHALRHTFAMRVLVQTDDVLLVKKLLGHRSLSSTLVYVEARRELPEECLVNLDSPFGIRSFTSSQLRLFRPAESG